LTLLPQRRGDRRADIGFVADDRQIGVLAEQFLVDVAGRQYLDDIGVHVYAASSRPCTANIAAVDRPI